VAVVREAAAGAGGELNAPITMIAKTTKLAKEDFSPVNPSRAS
jgi:hypothetical protein